MQLISRFGLTAGGTAVICPTTSDTTARALQADTIRASLYRAYLGSR